MPSHLAQVNCVAQVQLQAQLDEMTNCKVGLVVEVVSAMVIIIQHKIIVNKVNLDECKLYLGTDYIKIVHKKITKAQK